MEKINHINYPDKNGKIYCRKRNKVVKMNSELWENCISCSMFNGSYRGDGVECLWEDDIDDYYVSDPVKEKLRVSKDIDSRKQKKA